ncbi:MAG: ABC transporter permease subunit [Anaerolineales bacterium]|jgi:ABC-2 type transport system permease protein|uniref:ABC transporter permease n=1 Tax=Candidatus Villigracilis vicinus TaxID=3140679 RepID=UPI003135251E|nr:ABC transporter permease subunit [Anaerolineales bacterium]MBK7449255.1 ABC transporter permease subunit [Anaerolineales bacterium]MBK9779073.1 ABC transporter permease subunit [Anaerolineales bacterium]
MKNIWTIARREYDNYFNGPLAYVVMLAVLLPLGIYFSLVMFFNSQQAMFGGGAAPDITPINGLFAFLMIFLSPALTMRLLSDEARMGTLELLLTAPVRDAELVVGKWLGAMLFILTLLGTTLIYPLVLNNFVTPGIDWMVVLSSYIGLILLCATMLALGVGISAIFTNQFAAFFVTLGLLFFLYFMIGLPAGLLPESGEVFNYLSINTHYDQMNTGTVTLGGIVYYLSLISFGLFAGTTAIEIRRWR